MNVTASELLVALAIASAAALPLLLRRPPPRAQPLPAQWRETLQCIPHLAVLPSPTRALLEKQVEQFLSRKRFIGCNGLIITDEMRSTIAGLACLLLLRPGARVFPGLHSVLVYPDTFLVPQTEPDEFGLVSDEPVEHIGESWSGERVLLSWRDVEAALRGDEVNVVVHEFAHQLDDETPDSVGTPVLKDYRRWSTVMQREFERLRRHRRPPVLDPYGAENEAEFFAVVTEAYFQRGAELQRHHAELYALLRDYYGIETCNIRFDTET